MHKRPIQTLILVFSLTIACLVPCHAGAQDMMSLNPGGSLSESLDRTISLDLRDMDVVDVYKFLSLRGDFNISISKNISGRVTLYLKNVTIKDALDIISLANDLAYKVVGKDIVYIMTEAEYQSLYGEKFSDNRIVKIVRLDYIKPSYALETLKNIKSDVGRVVIDEDTGSVVIIDTPGKVTEMTSTLNDLDKRLKVHVFHLQYAKADNVVAKLREKLDNKAVGSTQADTRSNQVIVRAFPKRLEEASNIIKALDVKTKAVFIDVRILNIALNPGFDMGIDWQALFKKANDLTLAGSFPISSTVSQLGTFGKIAVGEMGHSDFAADVKFMKEVSSTKILAQPRIMVTNNEEARIHIGDKLAYVTTTTIGTGDSQRVNEEIHYIDVGVKFRVTPTINDDGYVTMKIQPEISSQFDTLETPQGATVPLINTTEIESNIIVKDGQTIIIAGLRQDNFKDTTRGVPGLMDVPFLGKLFSNTSNEKDQQEIAILMTPHIVTGRENYVDQQESERTIRQEFKSYD